MASFKTIFLATIVGLLSRTAEGFQIASPVKVSKRNGDSSYLMLTPWQDPATVDFGGLDSSLNLAVDPASFLTNSDVWVFVIGIIPFLWATIEFWRRIAVGEPFGTGSDSVIIGEDNNPDSSRGRRVLGKDALIVAYILFGVSAAVAGLVLYTVVTNDAPPAEFASTVSAVESTTSS